MYNRSLDLNRLAAGAAAFIACSLILRMITLPAHLTRGADMRLHVSLLALCLLCVAAAPKLAITEIQYDPRSEESDDQQTEWVEIWNYGAESVDLKGFQITSGSKARPHDAKQRFVLGAISIAPQQHLVIGIGTRECYSDFELPTFAAYASEEHYAWFTNDGDSVAIRDAKAKVIDEVVYEVTAPWPVVRNSGSTIQLVVPQGAEGADPKEANDKAENWVASNSTNSESFKNHGRGTPGEAIKEKKPTTRATAEAKSSRSNSSRKK
jgi:hypothetical protein